MKCAWLVLAAGCWSSAEPRPKPELVVAPVDPRAGAQIVKADPLEEFPDDADIRGEGHIDTRPPWTVVETGWTAHSFDLVITVAGKTYHSELAGGDGAQTPAFELRDIVPGGAPEIFVEVESITDGGKWPSVVVCGIGPSKVPSCASASIGKTMLDLNDDQSYKLVTPPTGGVEIVMDGKRQKLWFEFP